MSGSKITRYFFGSFPEQSEREAILARANAIQEGLGLGGNRVLKTKINLTLAFIGAFEGEHDRIVREAIAAGDAILPSGPHDLHFDRLLRFDGDGYGKNRDFQPAMFYPSVVPESLRKTVDRLREKLSLPAGDDITLLPPHVTWIYTDSNRVDQAVPIEPLSLQAESICLIRSMQGAGEYEIVQKWPL